MQRAESTGHAGLSARDLGRGSVHSETIDSLPTAAAAELRRFFSTGGGIADADGPSNSADIVGDDVPTRRSLRAYHALKHWIIQYEPGDFVTGQTTLALASTAACNGTP
ncbi:MAG: hypothetical protein EOO77_39485 [Oxalobacteraceae bacterium]|nr:MAG: hypothetical protein EOO77_39485 [Oxalobacteraceae bacterium]